MVERRVRFLWNNGGATQSVTHPLKLGTNNDQLLSDSHWYNIEATRSAAEPGSRCHSD